MELETAGMKPDLQFLFFYWGDCISYFHSSQNCLIPTNKTSCALKDNSIVNGSMMSMKETDIS